MMEKNYAKRIELYGNGVDNFEVDPFQSLDMLHRRSKLENVIYELTDDEKLKLWNYDLKLIENAKLMAEHIKDVYDFSISDKPLSEWWWHLDLVANGKLPIDLDVEDEVEVEL